MDLRLIENTALSLIKEYIHSHKAFTFEVASDYSMRPFLKKGDQIIIEKAPIENLHLGDIVVFPLGNNLCVHRFLYKYRPKKNNAYLLITKGDNSINPDPPFTEDRLLGKAVTIRRGKREIYLENALWRKINYILGIIYLFEVYMFRICRFIKNLFGKNKRIPFMIHIRKFLSLLLLLPSKAIIFILDIFGKSYGIKRF